MRTSIVEIVGLSVTIREKPILWPLDWPAFGNCFSAVSPKRIYLRHWNKRVMRTSIVEIVGLSSTTHEKLTLLPLLTMVYKNFNCGLKVMTTQNLCKKWTKTALNYYRKNLFPFHFVAKATLSLKNEILHFPSSRYLFASFFALKFDDRAIFLWDFSFEKKNDFLLLQNNIIFNNFSPHNLLSCCF